MTDEEKLREIVRKAAAFALPSNTQEFHLDMFTNSLMASGVRIKRSHKMNFGMNVICPNCASNIRIVPKDGDT